jgi:hypothetical protein
MDNSNPFAEELKATDGFLVMARELINRIKLHTYRKEYPAANEAAFLLAEITEKMTLRTRLLPSFLGSPHAIDRMEMILSDKLDIHLGFTSQGWFFMKIPALLPKKSSGSAEYIRSMLYPSARQFFKRKQPLRYPNSVIIFKHIYNRKRPERQCRDHDNIEVNMVVDIIALYILEDDTALRCAHLYCSAAGDTDGTEVYVVPQEEFIEWLVAENAGDLPGLLYDVPP